VVGTTEVGRRESENSTQRQRVRRDEDFGRNWLEYVRSITTQANMNYPIG
jgi:hypothetical protein